MQLEKLNSGKNLTMRLKGFLVGAISVFAFIFVNAQTNDQTLIKGKSLTSQNRLSEAARLYEAALISQPSDYTVLYQLAEVQNKRKLFKAAETAAIKSIRSNPDLPESHLLLSEIAYNQGNRARSVFALYYYLLLENDTARLSSGVKTLVSKLSEGVIIESNSKITIKMPASISDPEFGSVEILFCLLSASRHYNENRDKNDVEFIDMVNENLFNLFANLRENKKGFWWDFYVTRFCSIKAAGACKAFSNHISRSVFPEESKTWFDNNKTEAEQFFKIKDSWKPVLN